MAVKKHELVQDNRLQPDLAALEQYLQLMNEQHAYLPPPVELVKTCQDIVKCLSRASGNEEDLWFLLQAVEEFLLRIMNTVSCELRQEIVTAILDKFYSLISDPQSNACPAMSNMLVIIDSSDSESSMSAARWLVQERDNGPGGAGLRSSLSCLYRWMHEWDITPSLGEWIMSYIKALEENEHFDILIEVSLDNLATMFASLDAPTIHHSKADVIFHVLASLRESSDALDRISPHVHHVLTQLAADSGQWSRTLLQNVVDIISAMVDHLGDPLKGANNEFREKYANVISCLERHMASRGCRFLQLPPWRTRDACVPRALGKPRVLTTKVGLINLGNTCYMNSIMQALLVTRQFSTHVLLNMYNVPYWSMVGVLFAKMLHSICTKLNPEEFFTLFRPPFFTIDSQHDSSEFLGYLFELLSSYEHNSELDHNYARPAVLTSANRWRTGPLPLQSNSDNNNHPGMSQNRRSVSPRPGSSAAGSSSLNKRISSDQETLVPPKKRIRMAEAVSLRWDSFIDNLFGGVLLTRVECTHCHSTSLSRDVFRDLQLAFPEKPVDGGWRHSVQSLLDFYCSMESLSGDNKYQCEDCGVLRDAERSVLIETTPKHLILILKHFKFDAKSLVQNKPCYPMHYDSNITLPTVRSQADHNAYTLYAAVIHSGNTLDSGHYYTLAKDNNQWYLYNDDEVTFADEFDLMEESACGATPYILFYKRNDIEEPATPSLIEMPSVFQDIIIAHNKHYVEAVRNIHI